MSIIHLWSFLLLAGLKDVATSLITSATSKGCYSVDGGAAVNASYMALLCISLAFVADLIILS